MAQALTLQTETSTLITREKLLFGILYGAVAGCSLAMAMWIRDAILLQAANAFYPGLKLFLGLLLLGSLGAVAGFLAASFDRIWFSLLVWLAASAAFAWLTVSIPMQIFPSVVKWLNPDLRTWMNYTALGGNEARFWIALMWIVFFFSAAGILQSTLVDSAVFSDAIFSRVAPFLVCIVLGVFAGLMLDDLINAPLRAAIYAVEEPIQFLIESEGQPVDKEASRRVHAAAFRMVQEDISTNHHLIVSSFDEVLGKIEVLIKFDRGWVVCTAIYGQASNCKPASLPITQPVKFMFEEQVCQWLSVNIKGECKQSPIFTPKDILSMPSPAIPNAPSGLRSFVPA